MLRDRHLKVVSIWTSGANENTDLDVPPPPTPKGTMEKHCRRRGCEKYSPANKKAQSGENYL